MNKFELWVMKHTGTVIYLLGIAGFFTTLGIDQLRERPFEIGWLQGLGLMVFITISLFGIFVNKFLTSVKEMLEKYLQN